MYLIINGNKHTVSRRICEKDTIKYQTVKPAVDTETLSGTIQMFRDDGFLLSEDTVENFTRRVFAGTRLTLTNKPAPTPVDCTTQPEYRISVLEERLAESDEIAIDLYEASLAQEAINAEQDEAIIEIYEAMEALNNG